MRFVGCDGNESDPIGARRLGNECGHPVPRSKSKPMLVDLVWLAPLVIHPKNRESGAPPWASRYPPGRSESDGEYGVRSFIKMLPRGDPPCFGAAGDGAEGRGPSRRRRSHHRGRPVLRVIADGRFRRRRVGFSPSSARTSSRDFPGTVASSFRMASRSSGRSSRSSNCSWMGRNSSYVRMTNSLRPFFLRVLGCSFISSFRSRREWPSQMR
jgi:hypothetical protein